MGAPCGHLQSARMARGPRGTCRSKRPGRRRARSRTSARFVAASTTTPGGRRRKHEELIGGFFRQNKGEGPTCLPPSRKKTTLAKNPVWDSFSIIRGTNSTPQRKSYCVIRFHHEAPEFSTKPSISVRSWLMVCSRSSCAPPDPPLGPGDGPRGGGEGGTPSAATDGVAEMQGQPKTDSFFLHRPDDSKK